MELGEGGRGRRFLRITAKSGNPFCWLLEMRIVHRGSALEMTFNEPFGEQIIQWVRKIREKTSSKRCYVTEQTVRGMGTSLQRKDFWDRLGRQCVQ